MRGRARLAVLAGIALFLGIAAAAPVAVGSGYLVLSGLRESNGGAWHAANPFYVAWDPNPVDSTEVVHFAIRGPNHESLGPSFEGSDPSRYNAATVSVPPSPGVYWFEAWKVVTTGPSTGAEGTPQSVPLHFDNARPAAVSVAAPEWVAAGTSFAVRVSHPAAPLPISGVEGYAVTLDGAVDGAPCVLTDRCAAAEVDLPNGVGDDSTDLTAPPEGRYYVHASAVSGSGMRSPTTTLLVRSDGTAPQVSLAGAPRGWTDGPVTLTATAIDPLSGMVAAGPGGPVTAIGVDGSAPLLTPGAVANATVSGEGSHRVSYWARDAVGNAGDGNAPFAEPSMTNVRIDETDPTVHFAAGDPTDPERLEAVVADALSGPDTTRGEIALRRVGDHGRFQPLPTADSGGRLVARWDSDDFPHGAYEFRAIGFDAAGNSSTNLKAGAPLVLHDPVKRVAHLAFGFGGKALVYQRCARADGGRRCHRAVVRSFAKRPGTRAFPCCHRAGVGGRLFDADGAPLAGQTVDVVERFPGGAGQKARTTPVVTDAEGWFHDRLAPGPSRAVAVEFPGTRRLTRATGRSLRLRVRAAVRLRVSTTRAHVGGAPVVFGGGILHPGARIPERGLPVQLEFRLPGMPWTEFRTLQSDSSGHFAYPYSFTDDDSAGVRFLFRAFVPATGGWPFAPATSRPLGVTG